MSYLQTTGLSVSAGSKALVGDLNFSVERGECWGILGANGAGKTSLLQVLAGLKSALSGDVVVDGMRVDDIPRRQLAKKLGVLFQDSYYSFPVTVLETVMSGLYPHRSFWSLDSAGDLEICMQALEDVSLGDMSHRQVQTLSGGERRRLAIAILIVQQPVVWLLDEPTNHLDMHFQISLLELVMNRVKILDGASIMVLHDVNLLTRFCTHAILMVDEHTHITGRVANVITAANLEMLYHHPIHTARACERIYFLPG